jgi:hypothetical protein
MKSQSHTKFLEWGGLLSLFPMRSLEPKNVCCLTRDFSKRGAPPTLREPHLTITKIQWNIDKGRLRATVSFPWVCVCHGLPRILIKIASSVFYFPHPNPFLPPWCRINLVVLCSNVPIEMIFEGGILGIMSESMCGKLIGEGEDTVKETWISCGDLITEDMDRFFSQFHLCFYAKVQEFIYVCSLFSLFL